jgi:hypothetical protein
VIRWFVPIIGAVALVAGCAAVPTRASPGPLASPVASPIASPGTSAPDASGDRVVALVGTVEAMSLVAAEPGRSLQAFDGSAVPPDAAWLSGDGSTFVLTTLDGRFRIGGLNELAPASGSLAGPHPFRAFGSLGPVSTAGSTTGRRPLAFVEGDPGSGSPGRVIVVTLDGLQIRVIALPKPAESPPAWLPDGRIAVVSRDRVDRPETLLVDPTTGRTTTLDAGPLRSIGTAGGLLATIDVDGIAHVGPVAAWLAGETLPAVPVDPAGARALMAQPSPDGRELAVVLADANGDASSIRILAIDGAWHEIARLELPRGTNRAVVSWQAVR